MTKTPYTGKKKTKTRSPEKKEKFVMSKKRRTFDIILKLLLWLCAAITCAVLLFLIGYVLIKGLPHISLELLTTKESFIKGTTGILPEILNTVYIVFITLLIAVPLGIGAAIYLTEYATNHRLVETIEFATETLSGIPSIIYGLVGMLVFCQFFNLGVSLLAGAFTLVIMNLPTIIRTTQESIKTVPSSYREGSLALGSGKWRMIRTIVLPSSMDGIVTGCILAIGRIVGESAALLFTAGLGTSMNNFLRAKSSGATLTVALYVFAKERADFDVAFAIAAILMILTLIINLTAKFFSGRLRKREGK